MRFPLLLERLPDFRSHILLRLAEETENPRRWLTRPFADFASQCLTPTSNVRAIGIGLRSVRGRFTNEVVLKVYVSRKLPPEAFKKPGLRLTHHFGKCRVDVEELPIQRAQLASVPGNPAPPTPVLPVAGGVAIKSVGAIAAGTLACFLRPADQPARSPELYALSANHVMADLNVLPLKTKIIFEGPPAREFAELSGFVPVFFVDSSAADNRFDAAWARVTDPDAVECGKLFGGLRYDPGRFAPPYPGMRVAKVGAVTGVTYGRVTAVQVSDFPVEYSTAQGTRVARFDEVTRMVHRTLGRPFSLLGDSGALIVEEETGHPLGLLFSGDGYHSNACNLARLCEQVKMVPV